MQRLACAIALMIIAGCGAPDAPAPPAAMRSWEYGLVREAHLWQEPPEQRRIWLQLPGEANREFASWDETSKALQDSAHGASQTVPNLLGRRGWELFFVTTEEVQGGTQTTSYFRRPSSSAMTSR